MTTFPTPGQSKKAAPKEEAVTVRDLHKTLSGNSVLKGINLEVARGETFVIIGRSGCGKSVLLKNIVGLMKPDEGSVKILGEEVTRFESKNWVKLRGRMGMVFQSGALFDSLTVGENVALGVRVRRRLADNDEKALVREKLEQVGLQDIENLKPASLSGGMKKRVALARAIASDPEILLYDEPTTGLDPIMSDVINRLILDMQRRLGVTSIVVTHDMKSAYHIGNRIALLRKGVIHAVGTPDEIQNSKDRIVRVFVEGRSRIAASLN